MPVNTAVRAVVRSPGKAAPLGLLCLRVGAFTFYIDFVDVFLKTLKDEIRVSLSCYHLFFVLVANQTF